jgi:DNA-binding CsgD family transcriptional regulator
LETLRTEIEKHIKKLMNPLKEEEELLLFLKRKLTKKELKLLKSWAEGKESKEIKVSLHLDEAGYNTLSTKLIKKLNQERIKQVLCI